MAIETMSKGKSRMVAKWLIVVLLSAVAGVLLAELGLLVSSARGQQFTGGEMGGKGLIAVAGQIAKDVYGLYLVDPEAKALAVYQYQPTTRRLRLLASRNIRYDLRLEDYNTQPLSREIKELIEQQARFGSSATRPADTEPAQE